MEKNQDSLAEIRRSIVVSLFDKRTSISRDKLERIQNILAMSTDQEEWLRNFFISINIPISVTDELLTTISTTYDSLGPLYKYLQDRWIGMESIVDKRVNLIDVYRVTGIKDDLLEWLMGLTWKTQPPSGDGEAALAILLKNGRKPIVGREHGDTVVSEEDGTTKHIEVKGKSARLIGQRGFGDGPGVGLYFIRTLKKLAKHTKVTVDIPDDPGAFNFYKRKKWKIEEISRELIDKSNGGIKAVHMCRVIAAALSVLYKEATVEEIAAWVEPTMDGFGNIDRPRFLDSFFRFAFEYYRKIEGFDYFAMVDGSNVLMMSADAIDKHMDRIRYTVPSFGHRAGTQGKTFSISLK